MPFIRKNDSNTSRSSTDSNKSSKSKKKSSEGYVLSPIKQEVEVVALYNSPKETEQYKHLPFKKGEKMTVIEEPNEHWYKVRHLLSDKEGYVPSNYVCKISTHMFLPYFFPDCSRLDAKRRLLSMADLPNKGFMLRPSSNSEGLAMDVKISPKEVKHFFINIQNGVYFLESAHKFENLPSLIDFYQKKRSRLVHLGTAVVRLVPPSPRDKDIWEIHHASIKLEHLIGKGHYGEVFYAKWNNKIDVAVKILRTDDTDWTREFEKEATPLKTFDHPNVAKLYGLCSTYSAAHPPWIITEFMPEGSLLDYMKNRKELFAFPQVLEILLQVSEGMFYLETQKWVHRDLAARNVLIALVDYGCPVIKVSDFGLCRQLKDENDFYQFISAGFPFKWTAPEALSTRRFQLKCDVWSFGVLAFELFTGETPYKEYRNSNFNGDRLFQHLKDGLRLQFPDSCPPKFKEILFSMCFVWDRERRASFQQLRKALREYSVDENSEGTRI